MVAGYHLIWTVYGYWLPNDPRGSSSKEVRVEPIQALGEIHYGRKEVQPSSKEIREFYVEAREILAHAVLTFDDDDIALIGKNIGQVISDRDYICHACAIMPDHVHVLIRRHRDWAEDMIARFQEKTKAALIEAGKRPVNHPVWTDGDGWKTFINSRRQFESEIKYIGNNLKKIGKPEQRWKFVKVRDGWMPH